MQEITAYQTTDGTLFGCRDAALSRQANIIGEALDALLCDGGGNVTRSDRFRILLGTLKSSDLGDKVAALAEAVDVEDLDAVIAFADSAKYRYELTPDKA